MVTRDHTRSEALRNSAIRSQTNQYVAPSESITKYLESRDAISPSETELMEKSVDIFLRAMKHTHWRCSHFPRHLRGRDIPATITRPGLPTGSIKSPRKVVRAFDCAGHYHNPRRPPLVALPDLEVTRRFREYVNETGGAESSAFVQMLVAEPAETRESHTRPPRRSRPSP
jgi:hypothetical protein